ncbi:hypothetical protein QWM81_21780 [Streptomyces ficellus]|uniref:Uncharacterized protein n=1 Tax=Streptomyces ficellus TaxID=1977088 RepID=A0ABT7ZAU5_9ACTN|nr:hypothetical protein [Streptomyces ficellus]
MQSPPGVVDQGGEAVGVRGGDRGGDVPGDGERGGGPEVPGGGRRAGDVGLGAADGAGVRTGRRRGGPAGWAGR